MSKPHEIKTMFAVEGNSNVSLVIQEGEAMRDECMWFPDLAHAFTWCRQNRANFVYNPALPNN
jgi:hypothetical protein